MRCGIQIRQVGLEHEVQEGSFVGMILSDLERDPPFVADPHHVRAGVVLEPNIRITQPRAK